MCGVAAVIGAVEPTADVGRLLVAMAHRGPDGMGTHSFPGGAIGMNRLRIRDPHRLDLPPAAAGSGVRVAYNGEVYGTLSAGPATMDDGPTDVGAELGLLLGRCPSEVDGCWALVYPDRAGLVLARDRFGERPLYYRRIPNGWAVASEIRALTRVYGSGGVCPDAVLDTLAVGAPLGNGATVYRDIHAVPAGTSVWLSRHGRPLSRWTGDAAPDRMPVGGGGEDERPPGEGLLDQALTVSVSRNLLANRPVGLAFSGGLDSTLLADTLLRLGVVGIASFGVRVDSAEDGCSPADLLGDRPVAAGWRHYRTTVDKYRYLDLIEAAVAVLGYPTRMSSVPLYLALARLVAQSDTVILLTGEGADELFLGYRSYATYRAAKGSVAHRLELLHLPRARRHYLNRLAGPAAVSQVIDRYRDAAERVARSETHALRRMEYQLSLRPLLERADLCLMSGGVEGRSPYLHGDVPRLAEPLGVAELLRPGPGKWPLRCIARRRLGGAAAAVAKRPFRAPLAIWLSDHSDSWTRTVSSRVRSACQVLDFNVAAGDQLVANATHDDEAAALVGALLGVDAWNQVG